MDGSTAQAIATGSQDFAALAGLFCTDGVERNILAAQYGYGSVAVSSLSILGLLGLVKSTVKVALGLEKCITAGFAVDSLRGRFGYLPNEIAPLDLVECDVVDVSYWRNTLYFCKKKVFLEKERNPIVAVGSDWPHGLQGTTAINLGNACREKAILRHPLVMLIFALGCSGATAWLLLIVNSSWNWVTFVAIPGFHGSIFLMLVMSLLYEHQTNRPATHISAKRYKALYSGLDDKIDKLRFLQTRVGGGDVIHFRGGMSLLTSVLMPFYTIVIAGFCAVGYVCQYAILKRASTVRAFIWIGAQAFLALARVAFWTWNPSFDDPKPQQTEYALVKNDASQRLTFAELICAASNQEFEIDSRVWQVMASTDLLTLLSYALELEWDHSDVSVDGSKPASIPLLFIDFGRILRNRCSKQERKELDSILDGLPLRLGLHKPDENHLRPFFMTETSYQLVPSEYGDTLTMRWCWVEITKEVHTFGFKPCRGFAVKEEGERVHLRGPNHCHRQCHHSREVNPGLSSCGRGCPWKKPSQNHLDVDSLRDLANKMERVVRLQKFLRNKAQISKAFDRPDVYLTATPGTKTRKGLWCDPTHRYGGALSNKGFAFDNGVNSIADYIEHGLSSQKREPLQVERIVPHCWRAIKDWTSIWMVKEMDPQQRDNSITTYGSSATLWSSEGSTLVFSDNDTVSLHPIPSTPAIRAASPFHMV